MKDKRLLYRRNFTHSRDASGIESHGRHTALQSIQLIAAQYNDSTSSSPIKFPDFRHSCGEYGTPFHFSWHF